MNDDYANNLKCFMSITISFNMQKIKIGIYVLYCIYSKFVLIYKNIYTTIMS